MKRLVYELIRRGRQVEQQKPVPVIYFWMSIIGSICWWTER